MLGIGWGVAPREVWDAERSALSKSGSAPVELARLPPWAPTPIEVNSDGDDFAVVEVLYDPGVAFVDGANLVSRFEIIEDVALGHSRRWRKGAPADVVELVERYGGCNHWGSEEGYSPERREEIAAGWQASGCDGIEAEQRRLQKKYRGKPAILRTLDLADTYEDD